MNNKLFVSNIDWNATKEELAEHFAECGTIEETVIVNDRETWRPRGFWFITFSSDEEAAAAVEKFNWVEFNWRELNVNIAKPRV